MSPRSDIRVIRNSLIALVVATVAAVAMSALSSYFYSDAYRDNRAAQADYERMSAQYLNVDREFIIIEQRYPRFQALFKAGVLGAEDRLSWVESLKAAAQELAMERLDYRVEPRKRYDGPVKFNPGPFEVSMSRMHITATLLHEGDLPRLLERVAATARGLMLPRECVLGRDSRAQGGPSDSAGVRVNMACDLDWITLDWPGDREISL